MLCDKGASLLTSLFAVLICFGRAAGDVSWFVHLSDIHTSRYVNLDIRPDLESLAENVLSQVSPALIVSTGDQADSKTKFLRARQQEEEWISYGELHAHLRNATGLGEDEFLDVRGNHDTFDVPIRTGKTDNFHKYASSRRRWGNSRVVVTPLESKLNNDGKDVAECPVGILIGIDFSPEPGLRGPTNFLGWAKESLVAEVSETLAMVSRYNLAQGCSPTMIAYGHYPLGLIAYTERSRWPLGTEARALKRVEHILMDHGVAAFLCGHLHDKFGLRLHKLWSTGTSTMAELETADWKITRRFRIMSVDQGMTSFVDLKYIPSRPGPGFAIEALEETMQVGNHIVLVTSPPSAFYAPLGFNKFDPNTAKGIRALVFGVGTVQGRVTAVAEWSCVGSGRKGSIEMGKSDEGLPLYEAPWDGDTICGGGGAQIQVTVHADGKLDSTSELRLVHKSDAMGPLDYPHSLKERFTLSTKWPDFVGRVFLCLWAFHVFGLLLFPRLLAMKGYFLPPGYIRYGSGDNGKWDCGFVGQGSADIALGVIKPGLIQCLLGAVIYPLRMLCWVSHAKPFWKTQLLYCLYLSVAPLAVIRPMEEHPLGVLFRFGIFSPDPLNGGYTFLHIPDTLMVASMHYFGVVLPSTMWMVWVISSWQSKDCALNSMWRCLSLPQVFSGFVVWFLHIRMVQNLGVWYGAWAVLLSPGLAWFGPMSLIGMWSVRKDLRKLRTE
ncbi:hypothetical protein BSKO_10480 [Bryopsis sp. KO-2023]|nr:hypothetical protein BSKO_10480 [Bryopsis sp. KO-2023]